MSGESVIEVIFKRPSTSVEWPSIWLRHLVSKGYSPSSTFQILMVPVSRQLSANLQLP